MKKHKGSLCDIPASRDGIVKLIDMDKQDGGRKSKLVDSLNSWSVAGRIWESRHHRCLFADQTCHSEDILLTLIHRLLSVLTVLASFIVRIVLTFSPNSQLVPAVAQFLLNFNVY